ncbi:hypothetical protein [Rhizobium straminoryzae]|nr:hypothetical protein [Rhizobium straminoryzae]
MTRNRWIILAALVLLALIAVLASRPATQTAADAPGQPNPHAITQ